MSTESSNFIGGMGKQILCCPFCGQIRKVVSANRKAPRNLFFLRLELMSTQFCKGILLGAWGYDGKLKMFLTELTGAWVCDLSAFKLQRMPMSFTTHCMFEHSSISSFRFANVMNFCPLIMLL